MSTRLPRIRNHDTGESWVYTDGENMLPTMKPEYPALDRMVTFVIRLAVTGQSMDFVADGFRYDPLFVWDTLHKKAIPLSKILRWKYKDKGRKPKVEEMAPLMGMD